MCMFLFREEKIAVCFLIYVSIIFVSQADALNYYDQVLQDD